MSDEDLENMLRNHPNFEMVTMENSLIQMAFVKVVQWLKNEMKDVQVSLPTSEDFHSLFEVSDERLEKIREDIHFRNTHSKIPRGANHGHKVGSNAQKTYDMLGATITSFDNLVPGTYPTFNSPDDIQPLVVGMLEGVVNVFESDSYIQLCEANITNVLPISQNI